MRMPNNRPDRMNFLAPFLEGYPGPRPGSPEFKAARLAGQHPILDWLRSQRSAGVIPRPGIGGGNGPGWTPGGGGGYGGPGGPGHGELPHPPGVPTPPVPMQGVALGEPNPNVPLGDPRRRPTPRVVR